MALKREHSRRNSLWDPEGRGFILLLLVLSLSGACQILSPAHNKHDVRFPRIETFERFKFAGLAKTLRYSQRGRVLIVGGCQAEGAAGANGGERCAQGVVQVWNLQNAQLETSLAFPRAVTALAVSPDGKQWVVGDDEGRLFMSTTVIKAATSLFHQKKEITALAFSPDGRWVISGSLDPSFPLGFLDIASGGMVKVKEQFEPISALALSPDGKDLALGTTEGEVLVWNYGSRSRSVQVAHGSGRRVKGANKDIPLYAIIPWLPTPAQPIASERMVASTAFSLDGRLLAYGRRDGKVVVWDRQSSQSIMELEGEGAVTALAFSPDDKYLTFGQENGKLVLVESATGRGIWSKRHLLPISALAYSPDGASLAVSVQQHVFVYYLGKGNPEPGSVSRTDPSGG